MDNTITITPSGIAIGSPLVAGTQLSVTATGMEVAEDAALFLIVTSRFPDLLVASCPLSETTTEGEYAGTLYTATKQMSLFLVNARADEARSASIELVDTAHGASLARTTVPIYNSSLIPQPCRWPSASPLYVPGPAASVLVGTTTTLPPGSPATVENVGTTSDAVLNFGIPKGDPGTFISLPVSVANGGTGATTAAAARANLGAVNKSGDTMTGGLTVPNLTVGSRVNGPTVGSNSVAAGLDVVASGDGSHAEGISTTASNYFSHAEGESTTASGDSSHAEGESTTASGLASHAEGVSTTASGYYSHAEGESTTASGYYSHAEGVSTTTQNEAEHAHGFYNASHAGSTDAGKTISSIGVGSSDNARANAVEVMRDGKVFVKNVGGYDGTNPTAATDLAAAIDGKQPTITDLATIRSGAEAGATAVQPSALATVATTGDYDDLTNKPTIPPAQIQSDWNQTNAEAVDFIKNKPTIPGPAPSPSTATPQRDGVGAAGVATTYARGDHRHPTDTTRMAANALALFFSEGSTYAVGDYCTYEGLLYKCTTAVSTPGAWNAANWSAVAVTDEMGSAIRYAFASPTPSVSGTSATVACEDRAINDFTVATGITILTITPPAAVTGRARDFFCRVTLTDSSLPTVTLSGGTIDIGASEVAGMTQGVNLLMFTEIASGHWLASRRSAS